MNDSKTEYFFSENGQNIEKLIHLLADGAISISGKYLRRSQLSEELPPQYLVQREWWLALKLQRLSGRQEIGLKDHQGKAFTLGSAEFFAEAIYHLDRPSQAQSGDPRASSRSVQDQLSVHALREEAVASVQLDDLALDPEHARRFLRTGRQPDGVEEQAVFNVYGVLERMHGIRTQPLTLALLADLHQRLTTGTLTKTGLAGRLRQTTGEGQPAAEELSVRLKAMLALANGKTPERFIHPLLRAATLHYWMLHDQPFAEGNGRLARALWLWSVLHAGYTTFASLSLSAIFRDEPAAYQSAFAEVAQDENDLLHFVAYLFDAIAKAQRRSEEELHRLTAETQSSASLFSAEKKLNSRQRLLVTRALKEPGFRRTLQEHARDHNLVRQTARHDFAPLVKLGWFEETKIGRALTFFASPDLATRLQQ